MEGVELRSAYMRIEFSTEADLVITDARGIDYMEEINILTDEEIDNLCKVIRRTGGINPITNVANLGIQVSLRAKNNLKLSRFFLKHKVKIGRVAVATNMTLDNIRLLRELKESEKEHKDPVVSPVIDANNWTKTIESLEEYLSGNIGVKGVPVSYVMRSEGAAAPSMDEPEMSFSSSEDEMVACALTIESGLRTITFKKDIMKVCRLISVITRDLDCWTYVKSSQGTIYGRKA